MTGNLSNVVTPFALGVRLTVRAKPGLSRERAIKIVDIGDGKRAIEISVPEAARDGKANKAIEERIAEELNVGKKSVSIKSGATGRIKIVEILGATEELLGKIARITG